MVSSEMEEVLGMSDRVVVMRERRIAGMLPRAGLSAERVAQLMTGAVRRADGRMRRELGMFVALVLLCLGLVGHEPRLPRASNLINTTRQISMLGIFAIGISFVIITGGIDLSIGSVIGLTGVLIAKISGQYYPDNPAAGGLGYSLWIGIPVALAVAAWWGLAQGLLITRLNLQPFIVTLGGMLLLRGVSQTIVRGRHPQPGRRAPRRARERRLLRVRVRARSCPTRSCSSWSWPWSPPTCCTSPFRTLRLRDRRQPRRRRVLRHSVRRVETLTYVISALSGGIAGVCYAAYIGQMSQQVGIAYELYAIAAAVLGGVSLRGGEGTVLGSIIGSCIMRVIDNGINMFQWLYRDAAGVAADLPPRQQLDLHHHRRRDPRGGDPGPGGPHGSVEESNEAGGGPGGAQGARRAPPFDRGSRSPGDLARAVRGHSLAADVIRRGGTLPTSRRRFLSSAGQAALLLGSGLGRRVSVAATAPTAAREALARLFREPPLAARPMTRWWWFGGAVTPGRSPES